MRKENCTITYFLTQSLFLGYGISLLFSNKGKDAYIGAILGAIIGFLIISIYNYLMEIKGDKKLIDIFQQNKLLGTITRIIFFLSSLILLLYFVLIYKAFVTSFLLIETPIIFPIIPFLGIGCLSAFKGMKNIRRVSNCLFPASIVLSIIIIISLYPSLNIDNFLPILSTGPGSILKHALTFAGISVFPNILNFQNNNKVKNIPLMYLLSCFIIINTIILVNGIFGENLASIFRFPEYMVLKQLKFLDFVEKVENILSISWFLSLFVSSSAAIYSIKETLPKKKNKQVTIIILVLLTLIVAKLFNVYHPTELTMYHILPLISFTIAVLIIIPLYFLIKKSKKN